MTTTTPHPHERGLNRNAHQTGLLCWKEWKSQVSDIPPLHQLWHTGCFNHEKTNTKFDLSQIHQ